MWSHITDRADAGHVAAVVDAARHAQPRCGDCVVVAVDGPTGSGKSTLSGAVAQALGAPVVPLDAIYPGWDGLAASVGLLTTEVLEPIAHGEPAAYRTWDWEKHRWAGSVPVPAGRYLVVDGCGASVRPAGTYAAVRVWLDAPRDIRRQRGVTRDGDVFDAHWEEWEAQEADLFAADGTRGRADLVLTTSPSP